MTPPPPDPAGSEVHAAADPQSPVRGTTSRLWSVSPDLWVPVGAAVALQAGLMAALWGGAVARLGGRFTYPLDDTYIHMAMARMAATTGTWGINPGEFVSATSSPLWTAILAATYAVTGPSELAPLWINGFLAAALLVAAGTWLHGEGVRGPALGAGLAAAIVLTPLPYLAGLGMEHTLQTLLALALAGQGMAALDSVPSSRRMAGLGALAAGLCLTRYEGLFLAAPLTGLLWMHRRWAAGLVVGAGAGVPLVLYGAWSLAQGSSFLPNSLWMKSGLTTGFWGQLRGNLAEGAALVVVTAAVLLARHRDRGRRWDHAALFACTVVLQLTLARVGWLFRYEAWLLCWGLLLLSGHLRAAGTQAEPGLPRGLSNGTLSMAGRLALTILVVAAVPALRARDAWSAYVPNCVRIEGTDGTIAHFVGRRWAGSVVAVHDIGILRWRTDVPLFDLGGLASDEVCRLHREGRFTPANISALMRQAGVDLAVTEEHWMAGQLPDPFRRAGTLTLGDDGSGKPLNFVFHAVGDEVLPRLKEALASFRPDVPCSARLGVDGDTSLGVGSLETMGAAVKKEAGRLAFYTAGTASFVTPSAGRLVLRVSGSTADGRGPRFLVRTGGRTAEFAAPAEPTDVQAGPVESGQLVEVVYADDRVDAQGNDRNLFIEGARIEQ